MMHPRALLVAANLDVVLGGEEFGDTVVEGGKRGDAFVVVRVVVVVVTGLVGCCFPDTDFGSRFVEWLDMIHVGVWFVSRTKRDAPHYFHDTNAKMMIWKLYAKLVMHAPIRTLKCQIFMVM